MAERPLSNATMASPNPNTLDADAYNAYIETMRRTEYPMLKDSLYLDHAGTTLYSKTQMERFHSSMLASLYGNPHSASPSSQRSTLEIEDVRLRLLRFFHADPEGFDLVFVANATAGIKLVAEAMREVEGGFEFAYHGDAHTSLVGVREVAARQRCLESDGDVEEWLSWLEDESVGETGVRLFGYPAQSNMNGRRLPLKWCRRVKGKAYTLLDAAAYASTSPLNLGEVASAADFTVLSFNKIFGFPDLGALIVKKSTAHVFERRRFFGGGTVDMVVCLGEKWHARKSGSLHERLEDGTLPTHSILALKSAMETHEELFGTLERVSKHTAMLANELHQGLLALKHSNGRAVCKVYKEERSSYTDSTTQGPTVAFNLQDVKGDWISNAEVEKLASVKDIHVRTGGVCNPGGIAKALDLAPWEMRENFSAGHRCGSENDILNGKPTGVIRASLGASSTRSDVQRFLGFLEEFFVCKQQISTSLTLAIAQLQHRFYVESLTVYPIKSCGGWQIPYGRSWDIRPEGLAWDREWCIAHQGTNKALSQKQHPRMALVRPVLDLKAGQLRVTTVGSHESVVVPLSRNPELYTSTTRDSNSIVCGDTVQMYTYLSPTIAAFFTNAIGVPCTLARFNPASAVSRHSKPHLLSTLARQQDADVPRLLTLSNESPILTISRSSLNRLNEVIKSAGGKAAHPSVFRANIVLAEDLLLSPGAEQPWAEDEWHSMRVGGEDGLVLDFLGGCRRCQMICVDQVSGEKDAEPFSTLAKTRRYGGRVLFGVHGALREGVGGGRTIKVGDEVETFVRDDEA